MLLRTAVKTLPRQTILPLTINKLLFLQVSISQLPVLFVLQSLVARSNCTLYFSRTGVW